MILHLVLAVAVVSALSIEGSVPPLVSIAIGLLVLTAPSALLVMLSFIRAGAAGTAQPGAPFRLLRCALAECVDFDRAILAMIMSSRDHQPARPSHARPVLLVHGILCNRGVWRAWHAPLQAAGFGPIHALDLEPLQGSIDLHAETVEKVIEALHRACHGARVSVLAHSMGGLVVRAALRRLDPGVIESVVTIASPHHGTALASWLPILPARQMRPHSSWLEELARAELVPPAVPFTSVYGTEDNMIVPPASAILEGSDPRALGGVGHLGLLFRARCVAATIAALAAPVKRRST